MRKDLEIFDATTSAQVEEALRKHPRYRDDDQKLIAYVWWSFIGEEKLRSMTAMQLLHMYAELKLPAADSILRIARMKKRQYPELAGSIDRMKQRKQTAKDVKVLMKATP